MSIGILLLFYVRLRTKKIGDVFHECQRRWKVSMMSCTVNPKADCERPFLKQFFPDIIAPSLYIMMKVSRAPVYAEVYRLNLLNR